MLVRPAASVSCDLVVQRLRNEHRLNDESNGQDQHDAGADGALLRSAGRLWRELRAADADAAAACSAGGRSARPVQTRVHASTAVAVIGCVHSLVVVSHACSGGAIASALTRTAHTSMRRGNSGQLRSPEWRGWRCGAELACGQLLELSAFPLSTRQSVRLKPPGRTQPRQCHPLPHTAAP